MSFKVSQLNGFGASSKLPVKITQTANPATVDASSTTTATFSSVSIGEPSPTRIVAICITWNRGTNNVLVSSATINNGSGAVSMTLGAGNPSTSIRGSAIYYLDDKSSSTTATFTITYNTTVGGDVKISVYSITGPKSYTVTGASDVSLDLSADPLTASITVNNYGGALAVMMGRGDTTARTWTNITEDLDVDAGDHRHSTATTTTEGTVSITCNGGSTEDGHLSVIVVNPVLI